MPAVLIVEGIRLIHDRTRDWFDLTVWIDLDPDAAGRRAKARNLLQGDDQGELDLWTPSGSPRATTTSGPSDRSTTRTSSSPPRTDSKNVTSRGTRTLLGTHWCGETGRW